MLIILTMCAALTGECREERINTGSAPPSPQACAAAQAGIAQWVGAHYPGFTVQRYACADPQRMERAA